MKSYLDRTGHRVLAIVAFWAVVGLIVWLGGWWRWLRSGFRARHKRPLKRRPPPKRGL